MKITHVSLYANDIEALTFSLRVGKTDSKFEVRTILGLDADDIVPRFYSHGLVSGSRFYEFLMNPRDIVVRVKLNPRWAIDESYADIRDELYRAVSASRTGEIILFFKNGPTLLAQINGFITKVEVPHFTDLPEVQMTIRCDDPFLRSVNPVQYNLATFGLANPVIIGDSLSTAPHGINLLVKFTSTTPSFTIQDVETNPDWVFTVTPSGGFLVNDELHISSELGDKHVHLIRATIETPIVDKIVPGSLWPLIFPGANSFWFNNLSDIDWELIQYYPAYWGI